jgi:hypothetical protein
MDMKRWKAIAVAAIGGLALGSGLAWATIPDSNGVVHGCYKNVGGALRVIDPGGGGSCHAGETAFDWAGVPDVVIRSNTQNVDPAEASTFSVLCHSGEHATGGGYRLFPGFQVAETLPLMTAQGSIPIFSGHPEPQDGDTPDGWKVIAALNRDTSPHDVTVWVVCEKP